MKITASCLYNGNTMKEISKLTTSKFIAVLIPLILIPSSAFLYEAANYIVMIICDICILSAVFIGLNKAGKNFELKYAQPMRNEYYFYDTYFRIDSYSFDGKNTGSSKIEYDKIHKIVKTKGYFIIYIRRNFMYAVDASTINATDFDKLESKFEEILKNKYKTVNI